MGWRVIAEVGGNWLHLCVCHSKNLISHHCLTGGCCCGCYGLQSASSIICALWRGALCYFSCRTPIETDQLYCFTLVVACCHHHNSSQDCTASNLYKHCKEPFVSSFFFFFCKLNLEKTTYLPLTFFKKNKVNQIEQSELTPTF